MKHTTRTTLGWRKSPGHQKGLSLIESMIGITIGLLIVLVATGTMLITRQGSSTVSESYRLASAGNTTMRLIAATIRQAGAGELEQTAPGQPVNFGDLTMRGAAATGQQLVSGTEGGAGAADTLTVSYQHKDPAVTRDCLGNAPLALPARIDNAFSVDAQELQCLGSVNPNPQALVGDNTPGSPPQIGTEDFQVWYWVINGATQRRLTAADIPANGGWESVDALEICLQLRGTATNYPAANFTNCRGASVANGGRLHQMFRGTYKIRNRV